MYRKVFRILLIGVGLSILFGCMASQDDVLILDDRIISLERRVSEQKKDLAGLQARNQEEWETLIKRLEDSKTMTHKELADGKANMQTLETKHKNLTGKIESLEHLLRQKGAKETELLGEVEGLKKELREISARHKKMEEKLAASKDPPKPEPALPSEEPKPQTPPAKPAAPETKKPEELFKKGRDLYDKASYEEARNLFEEYLKKEPKGEQSAQALFLTGESFYKERRFEEAILAYQKVIQLRKGKVPEAQYRQGMAFLEIKDKENARILFNKVIREFPNSAQAAQAKKKLKELKTRPR